MNNDKRVLKGIVIDPGHGGVDSGAVGNGLLEKDLTLEISKYMYERFKKLGVPVFITRDKDEDLDKNNRPKKVLSAFGGDQSVVVISNHINAGGGEGAEVVYALRNNSTLAEKILNNLSQAGQKIRKYYQRRLPSNPAKDYYYILRNTPDTEAVIVEYGFIDNENDAKKLKNNYKEYAEAVVKAVMDYKGLPYKSKDEDQNDYVVKPGDTLWTIAKSANLSVQELKEINNLTSNLLKVGQVLKLTKLLPSEIEYIVKVGDTLYSIASKYNVTVDNIKVLNNLTSNILKVGQILKLPKTENNYDEEINLPEKKYIVKRGDTLYALANFFNIGVSDIKNANNLLSDTLSIGQTLIIPSKPEEYKVYTVQKGDSLFKIAQSSGTTVQNLKLLNNLDNDTLSIGQKLLLP